jgi:putative membrane protein
MDRRHLLAGLAGIAVSASALAQNTTQPQFPVPQRGGAYAGQIGPAEQDWMLLTMMVGSVAFQTSEIALRKAQNKGVKQFAQFERDEQTTIAEVLPIAELLVIMEPAGTTWPQGAATPPQPDQKHVAMQKLQQANGAMIEKLQQLMAGESFDKHAAMIEKLQQARAGESFDKEYVKDQIEGHQELLQIQERFLQSGPQSREAMNTAKLVRGQIKEHLALLKNIEEEL